jgi:outer membrane protein
MNKKTLTILLIFFSSFCHAQQILQLQDAIDMALKNSLDISIVKNNIEAATILNSKAVAGAAPVVTSTITDNEQVTSVNQKLNTGTTIQRNNAAANALNAGVTGSILLYNGGRVVATKKRLEELQAQSSHRLNSQVQNIVADVSTAYYDVVRQQNYIKTIDKSIDASNQQLSIVKARQSVGLANNADFFQAQIDVNALQQSKETQLLVVAQAKTELLRLLTAKTDSSIQLIDTIIVDKNISLKTVQDNLSKNLNIIISEDQIKINELIVKETKAQRYPSIRGIAGYNFFRNQAAAGQLLLNQNYGPTIGVAVTIPIFNGGLFRKQVQVANIDVKNANVQKQILLRDYNAQAVKLYQAYISNINQLKTEQENYKLSSQLLDLVLQRFQLKQATIVEVKNAQQSFEQSGFRLVNLHYAAKVSEIELKRLGE